MNIEKIDFMLDRNSDASNTFETESEKQKQTSRIQLTDDQEFAFEEIKKWLSNKDQRFKTLSGFAGTGKTTLLSFIVKYAYRNKIETVVTATTNKAVKVLREKIFHQYIFTIHAMLNIKPKRIGDVETFEPLKEKKYKIEKFQFVIIDECSMINTALMNIIKQEIPSNIKVLFCGDDAQLRPINEDKSSCFSYSPVSLTKIVRHGDTIANKSVYVRNVNTYVPFNRLLAPPTISQIKLKEIKQLFKNFHDNIDSVRVLAYTNAQVQWWNNYLRNVHYGKEMTEEFVEGDIVMANEVCTDNDDNIIMANSDEGIVEKVIKNHNHYMLKIKLLNSEDTVFVNVLYKTHVGEYNKMLKEFAEEKNWREYWGLKKSFHDIRHCYALTTHKSQGSTFENVILDSRNLDLNQDIQERNQLIYVAMTRASEKVFIF